MRSIAAAIFVCIGSMAFTDAWAKEIVVTDIVAKIVEGPDSDGDVWFAIKCTVKNNEDSEQSTGFILQAVDAEGFELTTVPILVRLKPGESKTVSTKNYMPLKDYRKIAKWQVKY